MKIFEVLKNWLRDEKEHLSGCDAIKCDSCSYNEACSSGEQNYKVAIDATLQQICNMEEFISCNNCLNKNKCMVHDNFDIQFCSDWVLEES